MYLILAPNITEIPGVNITERIDEVKLKMYATHDSGGNYECMLSYKWENIIENVTQYETVKVEDSNSAKTINFSNNNLIAILIILYIFYNYIE